MSEEEFYMEDENPKRVKYICMAILILITLFIVAFIYYRKYYTLNLKESIIYEAGDTISRDISDYVISRIVDEKDYSLNLNGIPLDDDILTTVGEYTYKIKYKNITKTGKLVVEDTSAPVVTTQDLTVGVGEDYDIAEFLLTCDDYSKPCAVEYEDEGDATRQERAGIYSFDIVVSDNLGNNVVKTVRLTVREGYSRENEKKSDLTIDHIEPAYDDWNNEMILSYTQGVDENELDDDLQYSDLLDMASDDLSVYLPSEYAYNQIVAQELIYVYNKYDYVIGFAMRVELDNGVSLYLTR